MCPAVIEKYVCYFKVSVHYAHFRQVKQSFENVLDESFSLFFSEKPLLLDEHVEIASVANLSDDEALSFIIEYLMALEDIGVVDLREDVHLLTVQLLQLSRAQRLQLDHLYRHRLA